MLCVDILVIFVVIFFLFAQFFIFCHIIYKLTDVVYCCTREGELVQTTLFYLVPDIL